MGFLDKAKAALGGAGEKAKVALDGAKDKAADLAHDHGDKVAGAIDKARVEPKLKELERAAGQVHEAAADTLNKLHDALTPPERAALVDKVKAHWAELTSPKVTTARVAELLGVKGPGGADKCE